MKPYHAPLVQRAERIISGRSTLEQEMETASTTECVTLCLIMDRPDHLPSGDLLRAWKRLDADQQDIVSHYNRSMGHNMRSAVQQTVGASGPR